MASSFKAIAPAELDPTIQRGINYQISRAAELQIAAALEGAPRQHLLAAANKAEQSARELAMEQPILAAFAKGDQVAINTIEGTLPDGVRVTSLTPVAVGNGPNSHSLTAASFAPAHKNPAVNAEAFWETTRQAEVKTVQLPDSLPARVASDAVAFTVKALLGINFRPGVIETIVRPDVDAINAQTQEKQQEINRPITAHLERVAAANFRPVDSQQLRMAVEEEINEVETRAQIEQAAAEHREYLISITENEARSAATEVKYGSDGTITTTVNVEALKEYQAALIAMLDY